MALDISNSQKLEFKTHTFYVQKAGKFISAIATINQNIYFEMVLSSKEFSYRDSLHDRNLALLAGDLTSLFDIEPNPNFLFKGTPIENERYLIHRFIKSIFAFDSSKLIIFESDVEYKQFCDNNNLEYAPQEWFKRIYILDDYEVTRNYLIQNSLVFQDLYFPNHSSNETEMPSLHDAKALNKKYSFKNDFADIYSLLDSHKIVRFYHFTDKNNIESIKRHGLLSQKKLKDNRISSKYSSSSDSRRIDEEMGLADYVRLSFVRNHPMMYTSMTAYNIRPVVLEINPLIALMPEVYFSDRNTLRQGANIGPSATDLAKIKFDIICSKTPYYDLPSINEKNYYQAEILIKGCVGTEMITNLSSVD